RGYLEGIDLARLADRYLETGLDLRVARTTIGWIESELARGVKRLETRADGQPTISERAWLGLFRTPAEESATARQNRRRKLLRVLD
ncbi:integrase, partial [Burkholderia sp. SIMBA_019]